MATDNAQKYPTDFLLKKPILFSMRYVAACCPAVLFSVFNGDEFLPAFGVSGGVSEADKRKTAPVMGGE